MIYFQEQPKNNDGEFKLSIISGTSKGDRGTEEFTYNGLNQLTGYESITGNYNGQIGLSAEYKYTADGYRLSKEVNGVETKYLWDGDSINTELYNDSDSSDYRFFYNAYGTTKYFDDTDSLNVTNEWGYCDQLYDFETCNYYMRARYYNPETGRFISEDTHWNTSNMIYDSEKISTI